MSVGAYALPFWTVVGETCPRHLVSFLPLDALCSFPAPPASLATSKLHYVLHADHETVHTAVTQKARRNIFQIRKCCAFPFGDSPYFSHCVFIQRCMKPTLFHDVCQHDPESLRHLCLTLQSIEMLYCILILLKKLVKCCWTHAVQTVLHLAAAPSLAFSVRT